MGMKNKTLREVSSSLYRSDMGHFPWIICGDLNVDKRAGNAAWAQIGRSASLMMHKALEIDMEILILAHNLIFHHETPIVRMPRSLPEQIISSRAAIPSLRRRRSWVSLLECFLAEQNKQSSDDEVEQNVDPILAGLTYQAGARENVSERYAWCMRENVE
jgi:hypothetical protein